VALIDNGNIRAGFGPDRVITESEWTELLLKTRLRRVGRVSRAPQGFGGQTRWAHDVIDEFRFAVYPLVLGSEKRLFREP
jgi:hypothetical protein